MFTCLLVASTLAVTPVPSATHNSVFYFDDVIAVSSRRGMKITQRTLDRTICPKIEQVEPFIGPDGTVHEIESVKQRRIRTQQMVAEHCQRRLMAHGVPNPAEHCGAGLKR